MILGMTAKITISLPDELAEEARRAVDMGRAPSVSRYIADAIEAYRDAPDLGELLDEWEAELGPPPPEAVEWARKQAERLGWHEPRVSHHGTSGGAA
jgi:Arc/MetJ-type ribon-helix-helix transcriptional regulator